MKKDSRPNEASSGLNGHQARGIPVAMLLILVVLVSAASGTYVGASFFPQQAPNVTVTTTIYTTTTSWTTSTIWSTVTEVVQGVLTTVQYTTSTSTVTASGTSTMITDTVGGTTYNARGFTGYAFAFPITLSHEGTVQSIGVNFAGSEGCSVRVALYSAGSNKPASLLTASSSVVCGGAGWQDVAVTPYYATAGSYWVALHLSNYKTVYYVNSARSYYAKAFGAFDSSWSASSHQDSVYQANMRVNYTGILYDNNSTGLFAIPIQNLHYPFFQLGSRLVAKH